MSLAQEYQLGIDTTGLVMGAGTDYIVHSWEGQGLPGMRASDRVRPFDHGSFMGSEYAEARQVTINMTIRGDDAADCQANLDALSRAWQFDSRSAATYDETTNLRVLMPGLSERLLKGRPRKVSLDTSNLKSGKATATLEFIAGDPRWYGATLRQATLNVTCPLYTSDDADDLLRVHLGCRPNIQHKTNKHHTYKTNHTQLHTTKQ